MLIRQERLPIREILIFGLWPSPIKKLLYRLRGYRIGKGVSIGLGAVVCGEQVSIGDYTRIGFLTIIRGKSITIGSFVNIGATTFLDTPHLAIGDDSRINEQVFVGGLQYPDSKLTLGRNCQIMQGCFINPACSITVGDDTGIGGDTLVFGHNSWLSQFEGYPVEFAPIEIGRSVSLAWRVFVLPGTRIGDGAVVGANSLVHRAIPPRCLAVGFPAKVVSTFPQFPRDVKDEEKPGMLRHIVEDMVGYFSGHGLRCESGDGDTYTVHGRPGGWRRRDRSYRMLISYDRPGERGFDAVAGKVDVLVSLWAIPQKTRLAATSQRTMWIDVEKKERSSLGNDLGEEVALFLKRYGVRFVRVNS